MEVYYSHLKPKIHITVASCLEYIWQTRDTPGIYLYTVQYFDIGYSVHRQHGVLHTYTWNIMLPFQDIAAGISQCFMIYVDAGSLGNLLFKFWQFDVPKHVHWISRCIQPPESPRQSPFDSALIPDFFFLLFYFLFQQSLQIIFSFSHFYLDSLFLFFSIKWREILWKKVKNLIRLIWSTYTWTDSYLLIIKLLEWLIVGIKPSDAVESGNNNMCNQMLISIMRITWLWEKSPSSFSFIVFLVDSALAHRWNDF